MFSCKYWEISKKPILKNICVRLLLKRLQEVIDQDFLSEESLSKTSKLSNITKTPFSFKPGPSLNLTPTLYFELRFPIFIINGYDRKENACNLWTSCCRLFYYRVCKVYAVVNREICYEYSAKDLKTILLKFP